MAKVPYSPLPDSASQGNVRIAFDTGSKNIQGGAAPIANGMNLLANEVERLNRTLVSAEEGMKKDIDHHNNLRQNTDLVKLEESEKVRLAEAAKAGANSDAYGFSKAYMDEHKKMIAERLKNVAPHLKDYWTQRYQMLSSNLALKAIATENSIRDRYQKSELASSFDTLAKGVQDNPNDRDSYVARGNELIDKTDFDELRKKQLKDQWKQQVLLIWGQGVAKSNPKAILTSVGGDTYYAKVKGAESGSSTNPAIKNPNSSATGKFQFTAGTWEGLVRSPEGRAAGLTIAGRTDNKQQDIAIRIFTQKNAAVLRANGIDADNHANLYLAHFLGAGGATAVLSAEPGTLAKDILPQAAASNKSVFYKDGRPVTVAELQAWAARKMGGQVNQKVAELNGLDFKSRNQLVAMAQTNAVAQLQMQAKMQQAQYQDYLNSVHLQIGRGEFTNEHLNQAIEAGTLKSRKDIREIKAAIKRREGDSVAASTFLNKVQTGQAIYPWDKADKKGADQLVEKTPEPQREQMAKNIAEQTGVLPTALANSMRGAVESGDATKYKEAMQYAHALQTNQPTIFKNSESGRKVEEGVDYWKSGIRAGKDADTISKGWAEYLERKREGKTPPTEQVKVFKRELAKTAESEIRSNFKTWWGMLAGQGEITRRQMDSMIGIYTDEVTNAYMAGHSPADAKAMAKTQLSKVFGVSNGRLMPYPPEKTAVPPIEGSYDWVYKQAAEYATKVFSGKLPGGFGPGAENEGLIKIDPKNVWFAPLPITSELVRNGEMPRWQIHFKYTDPATGQKLIDRITTPVTGRAAGWTPDLEEAKAALSADRAQKWNEAQTHKKQLEELKPLLDRVDPMGQIAPAGDLRELIGSAMRVKDAVGKAMNKEPTPFERDSLLNVTRGQNDD